MFEIQIQELESKMHNKRNELIDKLEYKHSYTYRDTLGMLFTEFIEVASQLEYLEELREKMQA